MKKVIGTTIAVLILGALIFFFLSNHWMMTTCFYRDNQRMATILNEANKKVSEYKYFDLTFKKDEVVGEKTTNLITSQIKIAIGEEGAYEFYAEKTLPLEENKTVLHRVYFSTTDNVVYVSQDGLGNKKMSGATINDAIKAATCTHNDHATLSKTKVNETALVTDLAYFKDYVEVNKDEMQSYNSSFLFTFSPFQVGVNFTKNTTVNEETGAFDELQYRIGFGGKILDKILRNGVEGVEGVETNYVKVTTTYNGNGSFVSIPALPQDTEMAD